MNRSIDNWYEFMFTNLIFAFIHMIYNKKITSCTLFSLNDKWIEVLIIDIYSCLILLLFEFILKNNPHYFVLIRFVKNSRERVVLSNM